MDYRREHVRRLLQVAAELASTSDERVWAAHIVDIARMGVAFVTDEEMALGHYAFSFCFPGSHTRNDVLVDVLYSRPFGAEGRYRNGARFEHVAEAVVERIVDYVTTGAEAMLELERVRDQEPRA
ncbi:MAG: PilZ domain-containing protein [Sphingomonadaceae bacterium]